MKLELTIIGKDKEQILKRLFTVCKFIIDDIYEINNKCTEYKLK